MIQKNNSLIPQIQAELDDILASWDQLTIKKETNDSIDFSSQDSLANAINDRKRYSKMISYEFGQKQKDLALKIQEIIEEPVLARGCSKYPAGGGLVWHDNLECVGKRLYLSFAAEYEKSFFRYQDWETKEIVTLYDQGVWEAREFEVTFEKPVWHCVESETERYSLGFLVGEKGLNLMERQAIGLL